jgi:DNA-directed RNA polymerase subunit H (RpoH/RPB5)
MKINELIREFEIWTTNEEQEILKRLKNPVKLSSLTEHDQFKVQAMIRKSLITKIGHKDPTVVANEKNQEI